MTTKQLTTRERRITKTSGKDPSLGRTAKTVGYLFTAPTTITQERRCSCGCCAKTPNFLCRYHQVAPEPLFAAVAFHCGFSKSSSTDRPGNECCFFCSPRCSRHWLLHQTRRRHQCCRSRLATCYPGDCIAFRQFGTERHRLRHHRRQHHRRQQHRR